MRTASADAGASSGACRPALDLEIAPQRVGERLVLVGAQAADEPMGGKHGQTRILERDQAHEHVPVRPLAADLLGVDARGLIAVVAVGDQQLGAGEHVLHGGDRGGVVDTAQAVDGAVVVGRLRPHIVAAGAAQRGRDGARGIGEQGEDGGEVGLGGAGEPQPILAWDRDECARGGGSARRRTPPRVRARTRRCACASGRRVPRSPGRGSTARAARRVPPRHRGASPEQPRPRGRSGPRRPGAGRCAPRCRASAPRVPPAERRR